VTRPSGDFFGRAKDSARIAHLQLRWQPKQRQVYDLIEQSKATHIGFGGSRGGSKSHTARQVMLTRRLKYPNTDGLVIRRTFKEVYGNVIKPMFRQWPVTRTWYRQSSEGYPTMTLPNGSKIVFGYAEHKEDIYDFQGEEYADVDVEEATHFSEEELRFLDTCRRWTGSDIVPKTLWTMNPGNVGHDYVKRVMVDRQFQENEDPHDYEFVQAYGWDNVEWCRRALKEDGLTQKDYYSWDDKQRFRYFVTRSDYGKTLWALPEQERDAHLFGDWESFVGQFFREFSKRLHVCKPFRIPDYWERFTSFDWGFTSPACQLWHAVSPEGRVYTYRESYVRGKDTPWLAQQAVKLTGSEHLRYKVGDPSCWDASRGPSIAEVMATNGWAMTQAENDSRNGWARVRQYLSYEQNESGQITREPLWQVFETCPNLIRTLPALVHDEHDPEDVDTKGEDHAPDALRYGLMTRPPLTIIPLEVMADEYREATIRAEHDEREKRPSGGYHGPLDSVRKPNHREVVYFGRGLKAA
jgi:phage terminase large subunit